MVAGHCFRLVRKDTGSVVAIITQASAVVATIARTSTIVGQGGTSNLQGFQTHHHPTYMGGGDSMVRTTLAIGRGVDDTRSIRDMGASTKRKENQSSSNSGRKRKASIPRGFQGLCGGYQGQGQVGASDDMLSLPSPWAHETGLSIEGGILELWDSAVPVFSGTSADTVYSFSPQCRPEGLVSVSGCCTNVFYYTNRLERPGYGSRSRSRSRRGFTG